MKIRHLAVTSLLALAAGAASADVTVNYVEPDNFTDLPFTNWEREATLKDLTNHFTRLGAQLPAGQNLKIDVIDVDLAGREYPGRGPRDLRIVKQIDWPRIDLRYTIEQDGKVLRSGDAQLRDMTFMDRFTRANESGSLRFEKRMIDEWFYSTIVPREQAARR
ncbi:DUF3016 domain-containing protein [Massilia sp. Dwa41.01b]|uniref:DUF3016 domain-containing protein n=1 Tax=unclassified Massilia TaxID=2609279 RepID=UPI0016020896|nr:MULTISPECIES: DUF3016 domain-containing protein [unclassified Massilia]QNA87734.1 DUF3016 domain-containing protein [Massilia sp. Dwa41.01b]QNA98633.1 DUF3016 domain-containing protein [Massilia sp. Se16.2.3]